MTLCTCHCVAVRPWQYSGGIIHYRAEQHQSALVFPELLQYAKEKVCVMSDQIGYWKELSDYDIETADVMLKSRRYLYLGFMCHQSIEKILKAYFVKVKGIAAPFSHSLSYIAKESEIYGLFSEKQKTLIDMLEPMNIECRYPTHKEQLLKSLTDERCRELFDRSKELQIWIKQKL